MEKKKARSSKRARGGAQWLDYAQLLASKGKKEAEEWIKALTALAEADPDSAEDYIKPHPTLGILDPTGKNHKMKLFRVQKIMTEDFTDEEEDTTERIFEGDMAEAPEDAFDEEDPPRDAGGKTKNKKKPRTPEDVAKAAEEAERRKKEKADKEQAQKADLAGRAATWLHRLPADIAKSKKSLHDVAKSKLPEDQKEEYKEQFQKHIEALSQFRDAIEDATAMNQYDAAKLNSADALVVKFRSDKKEMESVLKIFEP